MRYSVESYFGLNEWLKIHIWHIKKKKLPHKTSCVHSTRYTQCIHVSSHKLKVPKDIHTNKEQTSTTLPPPPPEGAMSPHCDLNLEDSTQFVCRTPQLTWCTTILSLITKGWIVQSKSKRSSGQSLITQMDRQTHSVISVYLTSILLMLWLYKKDKHILHNKVNTEQKLNKVKER